MFGDVYGVIVEDMTLKKKLLRRLFGQLLEKIGLLFTSTSGLTGPLLLDPNSVFSSFTSFGQFCPVVDVIKLFWMKSRQSRFSP